MYLYECEDACGLFLNWALSENCDLFGNGCWMLCLEDSFVELKRGFYFGASLNKFGIFEVKFFIKIIYKKF